MGKELMLVTTASQSNELRMAAPVQMLTQLSCTRPALGSRSDLALESSQFSTQAAPQHLRAAGAISTCLLGATTLRTDWARELPASTHPFLGFSPTAPEDSAIEPNLPPSWSSSRPWQQNGMHCATCEALHPPPVSLSPPQQLQLMAFVGCSAITETVLEKTYRRREFNKWAETALPAPIQGWILSVVLMLPDSNLGRTNQRWLPAWLVEH